MSRPNIYPDLFSPQPLRPNGTIDQLLANNGAGGFANVNVGSGLNYDTGTQEGIYSMYAAIIDVYQ